MTTIMTRLARYPLRPFIKLKAALQRNATTYADMTPEQLREHLRLREELQAIKDRQRDFLVRHRPPGAMF